MRITIFAILLLLPSLTFSQQIFNPATVISFQLPVAGFIKLKVFDLLGREIANLVNENLSAGSYKYDFNASALTSGIYFYKLETENFSKTRKMMLVK